MRASVGAEVRPEEAPATVLCRQHLPDTHTATGLCSRAANDPSVLTITFKTLLGHYAKQELTHSK